MNIDIIDTVFPAWHAEAACHPSCGHDPELWFISTPGGNANGRARKAEIQPAVNICKGCPVRFKCLQGAIERGETHGIWGGRDFGTRKKGEADDAA